MRDARDMRDASGGTRGTRGAALALAALVLAGCVYKGAKVTEGTDFSVGMNIPGTEGALQFNFINYLSGFRIGIAEKCGMKLVYTHSESNTWFGGTSQSTKTVDAEVYPVSDEPETATRSVPDAEASGDTPEP